MEEYRENELLLDSTELSKEKVKEIKKELNFEELKDTLKDFVNLSLFILSLPIYAPFRVGNMLWNNRNQSGNSTFKTILLILSIPVTLPVFLLDKVKKILFTNSKK
jgi:hypothetical protein